MRGAGLDDDRHAFPLSDMEAAHQQNAGTVGRHSCLGRVAGRAHIALYLPRVALTPVVGHSSRARFEVEVPFPDRYKNAGVVMANSAGVRLYDSEGRQENGVFALTGPDNHHLLPVSVTGGVGSAEGHSGFLGQEGVSADLHSAATLVLTTNALNNSVHLPALGRAVAGLEAFLRAPCTERRPMLCRHCNECQHMGPREGGAAFEMPTHYPVRGCKFESENRQPEDYAVNLYNRGLELAPVRSLLKKYRAAAGPAGDQVAVPLVFLSHLLNLWRGVLANSARVFPSNVTHLRVSGLVSGPAGHYASLKVALELVQFRWDSPVTCAQQTTRLFSLESGGSSGALADTVLSVDEIMRTTPIVFE